MCPGQLLRFRAYLVYALKAKQKPKLHTNGLLNR